MFTLPRLTLALTIAGLLLTGCADRAATKAAAPVTTTSTRATTTSTPRHVDKPVRRSRTAARAVDASTADARAVDAPENTGVAACDDYLSSYLACHRAAKIYAPDQLQSRYEAMRTSLLRDSQNPDIRPQLGARCNSLASQLRQALHGKSCASAPAPSSGTP